MSSGDIPECQRFVGGSYVERTSALVTGARYDDWKRLPTARNRPHHRSSVGDQYHVDGPLAHTILFGKFGIGTWVQLERHPIYDWSNHRSWGSIMSNTKLVVESCPYGSSAHSENTPLIINTKLGYFPSTTLRTRHLRLHDATKTEIKPFKFGSDGTRGCMWHLPDVITREQSRRTTGYN